MSFAATETAAKWYERQEMALGSEHGVQRSGEIRELTKVKFYFLENIMKTLENSAFLEKRVS